MLLTLMLGGAECFWPQAIILLSYCHIVNQSSHYMKISQVVEPTHHTRCLISAQWRKFFLLRSLFVPLFSALFETIASDDGARNPMRSRWLSRSFCFFFLGGGIPKFPQVSGLYIIHGLFSRKNVGCSCSYKYSLCFRRLNELIEGNWHADGSLTVSVDVASSKVEQVFKTRYAEIHLSKTLICSEAGLFSHTPFATNEHLSDALSAGEATDPRSAHLLDVAHQIISIP